MRSFTARDLIALPRLTAVEAFVLTTELLTAADAQAKALKGKGLPAAIERSRKRLADSCSALDVATRPQRGMADTQTKRKADRKIDNAWSATFDWLGGWCKLPEERNPDRADAVTLFTLAFPGASLSFTKSRPSSKANTTRPSSGSAAKRSGLTFSRLTTNTAWRWVSPK